METPDLERRVISKISWRLLPFMCLCYFVAFIDRTNLGAAKLQMTQFDKEVYGLAAGIFFWGYFLFEVPSNIILEKVGARIWIARIMILWGLITACTMFVADKPIRFYAVRFLLGLGEAGFFPGMILYLTYWFPTRYRTRTVALFMTAGPISSVIGNPLSGVIMKRMSGVGGLAGWQWLFVLEGLPACLMGIAVLFYLRNGPLEAPWLSEEERLWLKKRLQDERTEREAHHHMGLWAALRNPMVLILVPVYFANVLGGYGLEFFLPKIVEQRTHWKDEEMITLVSAIPSFCAVFAMTAVGRHSDKTGERRVHVGLSMMAACVGLLITALAKDPILTVVGMCLAVSGRWSCTSTFWGLPTAFLSGTAAAGGIAWINSLGNLGGYVGPTIMGKTHTYETGLMILAGFFLAGGILACVLPTRKPSPA
ncbi:MAG TPA: MFS transporter, partial [Planctomycetota bacterium]|nr:MFS transporter [Planctomycetota bacterium]